MSDSWEDLDEGWDEVETGGGYQPPPPGVYQAQITVSRPEVSDWDAKQIRWEWQITDGPLAGKKVGVWDNCETDVGRSILKSRMEALGVGDIPPSEIKRRCEAGEFIDVVCEIYVGKQKPKDDGSLYPPPVYINKALGVGERAVFPTAATDDDIPF